MIRSAVQTSWVGSQQASCPCAWVVVRARSDCYRRSHWCVGRPLTRRAWTTCWLIASSLRDFLEHHPRPCHTIAYSFPLHMPIFIKFPRKPHFLGFSRDPRL